MHDYADIQSVRVEHLLLSIKKYEKVCYVHANLQVNLLIMIGMGGKVPDLRERVNQLYLFIYFI